MRSCVSDMIGSAPTEDRETQRLVLRKVSRRLLPYLFVMYVAAYLDRINVGFAQLQMKSALGFSDTMYGLGTGVFFFGYFLFEVPSNIILARTGARLWLARIMITWGLISSAMALVRTSQQFYVLRFLLGVAEAGFFPGVIYYLSHWFPASARASAISRFMTAAAVSGVVGGPLSAVLFQLDGVNGLAGWQWIFVVEGIPSVLLGVMTLWFLTDRPAGATWLRAAERDCLEAMLRAETADILRRGHVSLRRALLHPTVWRLSLLSFTLLVGFYSISFWLPQIVASWSGRSNVTVALLSAIPYAAAAVAMVGLGVHSDRKRERCLHVAGAALVGAAGLAASAVIQAPVPSLIALSVAAMGIFSAIPVFWSLPTTFLSGTAAAGAIALINSLGNLGGFVGPYFVGRVRDLTGGFAGSLLAIGALVVVGALLAVSLRRTPVNEGSRGSERRGPYALGHSDRELERLPSQARLIDPITRRFFCSAGIGPGLRVLDVGSGTGDVAFLLAELVGHTGEVVGVDRAPEALAVARARAEAGALRNVTFLEGDPVGMAFEPPFDAIVGRYVLQFQPDAVAMLRALVKHLRPGGTIAFHELDWAGAGSSPPSPTYDRCCGRIVETIGRLGAETRMGNRLHSTFVAAGLPAPIMRLDAIVGGGANGADAVELVTDLVETLLPAMERLGVATAADLELQTLSNRMSQEVISRDSVIVARLEVGAWSHMPERPTQLTS